MKYLIYGIIFPLLVGFSIYIKADVEFSDDEFIEDTNTEGYQFVKKWQKKRDKEDEERDARLEKERLEKLEKERKEREEQSGSSSDYSSSSSESKTYNCTYQCRTSGFILYDHREFTMTVQANESYQAESQVENYADDKCNGMIGATTGLRMWDSSIYCE